MQYVSLTLVPEEGWGRPDDFPRETIHYMNLLADGTAVFLTEYPGDESTVAERVAGHYEPIEVHVSGLGENALAYVHFEPNPPEAAPLRVLDEHPVAIDMPVYVGCETLHVTVVGDAAALREALADVPDGFDVGVQKTGRYDPPTMSSSLFAQLTESEQTTLQAALRLGYYEVPRTANHEDVADELGISRSTVGEHLRRAESKLVSKIIP